MATQANEVRTFVAGAALAAFRRVKLNTDPTEVVYAGSDEAAIGVTQLDAASGANVPVRLWHRGSTFKVVVASSMNAGASLYGAANGKFDDADPGSGTIRGKALAAASGDGSVIEVLPV